MEEVDRLDGEVGRDYEAMMWGTISMRDGDGRWRR